MGNRCQRMLSEESDMSVSYSRNTNSIRSSSSKKRRSFKERLIKSCVFLDCTGMKRGRSSSFDGTDVYSHDAISKPETHQDPHLRHLTETEKTTSASSNVIPRRTIMPRDELNKEADDFIARMKGQMKIERKESDVEYMQRIERGAL